MTPSDTNLISRLSLVIILAFIISCDVFTEVDKPEKQVTLRKSNFHILPGTSVVIDLKSVVNQSFSDVTLMIFEDPARGALTPINSLLYKYTPGREFQEGKDDFVVAAVSKGKILAKSTLAINMSKNKESFPCELFAIEDKIKFKKTDSTPVVIQVLENDRLCEINKSDLSISILTTPKFGQAVVNNESIVYTPGPEYKDYDELIYQVTRATDDSIFYGLVSVSDRPEFTIQKIAGKSLTSLFFIDENTGFLGTTTGLYRTSNGGTNWNASLLNFYCQDIFFLNETKGFAAMDGDQIFTTDNGGVSWKLLPYLDRAVLDVVFTSETTGFIVVSNYSGDWDYGYLGSSILKTEDGGLTWREVFTSPDECVDIQFANSTTGYAIFYEQLFVTTDAGETWNLLLDKSLKHLDVTAENKVFAVLLDDESEIITNDDGYQWRPVADLLFGILSVEFSPAVDVGFASTFTSEEPQNGNPYLQSLSIVKTVDQGETWAKQNLGEPLYGFPFGMSVPSNEVAYFLCSDRILKYSYK